jgi:hypothetical protein
MSTPTARASLLALALLCATAGTALAQPHAGKKPACRVDRLTSGEGLRVSVSTDGRVLSLAPLDGPPQDLRVYAAAPDAVLVAYAGSGEHGPFGSSTLWRIPCAQGAAEAVAHIADADFGHAALSHDRRTLYFTGADGIFALDLATFQPRRLTQAARDTCTRNHVATRDVVGELVDARTLSYDSRCAYEHEWNALPMLLRNPGTAKMTTQAVPRPPPSSFALGPDGQIWLADGTCAEPATFGRVMVSSDHGDRWRPVVVKTPSAQPVRQVILDRSHAGTALIFTTSCASAPHTEPGWIYLTENGGRTFRAIAPPPGIRGENGRPAAEQEPVQAIVAPDGMLNHLVLYGQSTQSLPGQTARWESRDGGRSWEPLAPVAAAPKPTVPMAAIGGMELAIRKDGLYRTRRGEAPVRVYP